MPFNDTKFYGFTNDEIFGSIMQNKRFCKAIIQAALPDINVVSVESIDAQKELGTKSDKHSKSVRLDIAVKDQSGNLYDCEMQVNNNHDIGPRMRYYQSSMDRDTLDRGEPYTSLSRTYLIFLCAFDPFGKGKLRYSFHLYDDEDKSIQLKNNAENIIINSKGSGNENIDLLNLKKLMNDDKIESKGIFKEIQTKIQEYNDDPKRRNLMRTAELRMKEETAVAEKRGREAGDKNTVRSLTLTIKEMCPEINELDLFKQIKKTVGSDFSLNDAEIKTIIHQNLK
ncbi:MAG: Rpn family recombination-promoting nuclease/putative transposase [Lactobacillus mulieris]|uniref:Rpn family recombination-promoting nuclease/putative transposase n=1 Tax=Lactobacillus mulieris TaxID=2508708 RepID=A0AAP3GWH9_9LACO|nr:Rpn family recombination-promoting nuclease/putative transposase [Lactobacillus mulieris]MCF1783915.1 Rpn family recombination-promoting nuclease/putative transposase [Lactobacillus mulieris]MCT7674317.1 Rpn family recombination-promoting nuclease/putative transposase [Lactobacillus mulieris]MCT7772684.1 Rpn family recombination-promoting nuclease/putative transposase [Lactobacillus mulieris]MCW8104683.1 Rpn family recombination-promoting nuclease/putative transposase [Lactobacillus mulieris